MRIIEETFVKDFFGVGLNLFACVWEQSDGYYGVQLGHSTLWYKKLENALKAYDNYVCKCRGI